MSGVLPVPELMTHQVPRSSHCLIPRPLFPQIALAIGVLTSSWWVRVRRFCGFVAGGAVTQGVVGGVAWCVQGSQIEGLSLEALCGACRGQGLQIQDRAVTRGVVRGVVVCVGVRVRRCKTGLSHRVSLEVFGGCRGQGSLEV